MGFKVYWAARDLGGSPMGNHHFILIYLDANYTLPPLTAQEENGQKFVTLATFDVGGNLDYVANQATDVLSVKEALNSSLRGWFSDYDMSKHKVHPKLASPQLLAQTLVKQAQAYKLNSVTKKVKYSLTGNNCAAWVNTMFKVAGIPEDKRNEYGEFTGVDWREEALLDESLFA